MHDLSAEWKVANIIILSGKPLTLWNVFRSSQGKHIFLFSKRARIGRSEADLWFLKGIGPTFKKS